MAKEKLFTVTLKPTDGQDKTFVDANGNERERMRSMTMYAEDENAAKEMALEQSLALGRQYGEPSFKVTKVESE